MARRFTSLIAATAVAAVVSALLPTPAWAVGRHGGSTQEQASITQLEAALGKVNLTSGQKSQVSQILAAAQSRRGSSTASGTPPAAGTTSTAHTCGKGHRGGKKGLVEQVMAVLTSAQQARLKQLMPAKA